MAKAKKAKKEDKVQASIEGKLQDLLQEILEDPEKAGEFLKQLEKTIKQIKKNKKIKKDKKLKGEKRSVIEAVGGFIKTYGPYVFMAVKFLLFKGKLLSPRAYTASKVSK